MPRRLRKLKKFWLAIELLPQWCAVRAEWRWLLGPEFDLVAGRLRSTGKSALSYPHLTADGYGPPYRVVTHEDGQLVGVAEGGRTIPLTRDDVALHELSPRELLRDLGSVLGLDVQPAKLDEVSGAWQIGSVLPGASQRRLVFFIGAPEQLEARQAVEHLTARHQEPFVLLVPTPGCLDSRSLALLESRRAVAVVLQDVLGIDDRDQWCGLQPRATFVAALGADMTARAERVMPRYVFRRQGRAWQVIFNGTTVPANNLKGLDYIALLLAQPGRKVHVAELLATVAGDAGISKHATSRGAAILDKKTFADCQKEFDELREELAEAEKNQDRGRQQAAQAKIDKLAAHVSKSTGLGGKQRRIGDDTDRSRKAISNAISRALTEIGKSNNDLWRHLANSLSTGQFVSYSPESPISWET